MKTSPPRRRGRPRSFDEEAVLDAVTELFWTKGFAAASLDELAAAAGVNRPSLYAALGDKKAMFLKALERFEAGLAAAMARTLHPSVPLGKGLLGFYRASLDLYTSGSSPRGCLILSAAAPEAAVHADVRGRVQAVLSRIDDAFAARFAAAMGREATDAEVKARAALASALLHSLATRTRAGEPRQQLDQMVADAVILLADPSAASPRR
jgi:TetR/AcrR family transcriptional regulator, copper-responsive repressor